MYVDDIKLAGKKQNLDPMWKLLNKEVDLGEPTSFLDHVCLGCTQRQCEISKDIVDNYRTMFESRISAGATKKLPCSEKLCISSWSNDMVGHAKKCVERSCELANKSTQQLYKVTTTCIDDHHFKEEEMKSVGELSNVCSQMVLKCMYLALIGWPDTPWSVNKLARSVTKWTKACDKRLNRLISYNHHTCEYKQYCHVDGSECNGIAWCNGGPGCVDYWHKCVLLVGRRQVLNERQQPILESPRRVEIDRSGQRVWLSRGSARLRHFDLYTFVTSFPSACLRTQVLTMCRFTVLSLRVLRERVRLWQSWFRSEWLKKQLTWKTSDMAAELSCAHHHRHMTQLPLPGSWQNLDCMFCSPVWCPSWICWLFGNALQLCLPQRFRGDNVSTFPRMFSFKSASTPRMKRSIVQILLEISSSGGFNFNDLNDFSQSGAWVPSENVTM